MLDALAHKIGSHLQAAEYTRGYATNPNPIANVLWLPLGVEASRPLARQPLDLELLHLQSRLRTRADLERTLCSSLSQPAARS